MEGGIKEEEGGRSGEVVREREGGRYEGGCSKVEGFCKKLLSISSNQDF